MLHFRLRPRFGTILLIACQYCLAGMHRRVGSSYSLFILLVVADDYVFTVLMPSFLFTNPFQWSLTSYQFYACVRPTGVIGLYVCIMIAFNFVSITIAAHLLKICH